MTPERILRPSIPLAVLIIAASCAGLGIPGFYSAETLNWQVQSMGQDLVDLVVVVPALLVTSWLVDRHHQAAVPVWGGIMVYLTYTFVLYCFDVHFNRMFLVYCLVLGLSFYSLLGCLLLQVKVSGRRQASPAVARVVGVYFIGVSVLFSVLWLSEVIPSMVRGTTPQSLLDTGLVTNGVQVLDLAVVLPAIAMTGIFLLRGIPIGHILAPMVLTFFVLMDLTIAILAVMMDRAGVGSNPALVLIMVGLAVVSLVLLVRFLQAAKPMDAG